MCVSVSEGEREVCECELFSVGGGVGRLHGTSPRTMKRYGHKRVALVRYFVVMEAHVL